MEAFRQELPPEAPSQEGRTSSWGRALFLSGLLSCLPLLLQGQLSPGDLAAPHAHLEGLSNCTQCHTFGEKVSNAKCLACHDEIQDLLDAGRGYHANPQVRGQDCFRCHSEHHGRNFQMVRLDEASFNHDLTGFELTGAHRRTDCRQCHTPDLIQDPEIRKRADTYLGLGIRCVDCHEDVHQQTLGTDCTACHDTEAFAPAAKFDHQNTDFPLRGRHRNLECTDCHQEETRNGKPFRRFAGIPFQLCSDCHQDPHQNQLGNRCHQCHTEQSFAARDRLPRFPHHTTGFPLRGSHQRVDCFACHTPDPDPLLLFQDHLGTAPNDCAACHDDPHQGRFGNQCTDCHNEDSFRIGGNLTDFDHDLTDFPLEGRHEEVDCRQCHTSESFTDPLPHQACADCHEDYHRGAFDRPGGTPDCAECHHVQGFAPSLFSPDDHQQTDFPLEGAHLATPCLDCHVQEQEEWNFSFPDTRCIACHEDVHAGQIDPRFYPDSDCRQCHSLESWTSDHHFDHSRTDFPLEGAHAATACADCHTRDDAHPHGRFQGLSTLCADCHDNPHADQFAIAGVTDCARCHDFEHWAIPQFDHNQTAFPLEGKHAELDCAACHFETEQDGRSYVLYKTGKTECRDCHR